MQLQVKISTRGGVFGPDASEVAKKHLTAAVSEATALLTREIKLKLGQGDRRRGVGVFGAEGGLLGSIQGHVERENTTNVLGIVSTAIPYAEVVEKGRRPDKKFPPKKELSRWIEVKLGVTDPKELKAATFLIGRKIAKKGFDGLHMFENALRENEGKINKIFDDAAAAVKAELDRS